MFFVLHADKAKGLQINLSETLQGKNHKAYLFLLYELTFLCFSRAFWQKVLKGNNFSRFGRLADNYFVAHLVLK